MASNDVATVDLRVREKMGRAGWDGVRSKGLRGRHEEGQHVVVVVAPHEEVHEGGNVVLGVVTLEPLHSTYSMSRAQASRGWRWVQGGQQGNNKKMDQQQRESPDQATTVCTPILPLFPFPRPVLY